MLYHSGGSIGTSSWLALYPEQGGIFLVTNIAADNTQDKLNEIANIIVDKYTKAAELK